MFDVKTGEEAFRLSGAQLLQRLPSRGVSWSPDGRYIAASSEGTARVWDAETGTAPLHAARSQRIRPRRRLEPGFALAWSPGGSDGTAKVWEIGDGGVQELWSLSAQETKSGIVGVAFSPDGTRVMAGDAGISAVKIWDLGPTGDAEWANLPAPGVSRVEFMPDGRRVVARAGMTPGGDDLGPADRAGRFERSDRRPTFRVSILRREPGRRVDRRRRLGRGLLRRRGGKGMGRGDRGGAFQDRAPPRREQRCVDAVPAGEDRPGVPGAVGPRRFYAELLGMQVLEDRSDFIVIGREPGMRELGFQRPDRAPPSVARWAARLHLDLHVDDVQEATEWGAGPRCHACPGVTGDRLPGVPRPGGTPVLPRIRPDPRVRPALAGLSSAGRGGQRLTHRAGRHLPAAVRGRRVPPLVSVL